ncbi:MAG: type II toxin-antitoxin system HicA family toxin [Ignavibacteria bacterium]|nr:type II toxin-antitoxin system HicA family toxin [Ignavibacteria bacterium]MCC7159375.1 type II toxin-antitoxin system HicA family toxin [Ignavibacteria bacterium]
MPKFPRLKAKEAEDLLLKNGFELIRSKGSHRIYQKERKKITIPFHSGKILHPKIVKQIYKIIED